MTMIRSLLLSSSTTSAVFAPDFSQLLAKPTDEIKKPKPLPEGSYQGNIQKYEFREADTPNDKENPKKPVLTLHVKLTEAMSDVDEADLNDALQGENLSSKPAQRFDMWLTPDAQYRVVELCVSCGIPTEGRTLGEIIPELQNQMVTASVSKTQSKKDPEVFYSNIDKLVGTSGA